MKKTIEITTTQNVTIEYELAALHERIRAWVLDLVIFMFGWGILSQLIRGILGSFSEVASIILVILGFSGFFLYHIIFEIWNLGQTPGKKALSIKVVRLDGNDPEWGDVVLRAFLHLVDSLFCLGAIGSVLIKTTGKSQRFGDMAANTTVIKLFNSRFEFRLEDILSISSLQNYTPVFPQVRKLTEHDMLFIKNVLSRHAMYPNQAHHEVVEDLVTHLMPILGIDKRPDNRLEFLKTLLRDYIVLTR
jgi:uncharacterized RDD family membrane protein YckC